MSTVLHLPGNVRADKNEAFIDMVFYLDNTENGFRNALICTQIVKSNCTSGGK